MNTNMISCAIIAGIAGIAQADITVDWYRTASPNVFGAASYAGHWDNIQQSILDMNGLGTGLGNGITDIDSVTGIQSYVTTFESLDGVFAAGEYGTRPSWAYYISNDDGSIMDNSLIASSGTTSFLTYSYGWNGTEFTPWSDYAFGGFDSDRLVGVHTDGTLGVDTNGEYVGFIAISGNAWVPSNWTGTLGVDHVWTTTIDASDPDRFTKLAELGEFLEANQDYWGFSINLGGQEFVAPNINVVPAPTSIALLGLSGLVGTRRRR